MPAKIYPRNETFYVKKRQLMRKADQLFKYCQSDVFILVNNREIGNGKVFCHQTDPTFDLSAMIQAIQRDLVKEEKNKKIRQKYNKHRDIDFDGLNQQV